MHWLAGHVGLRSVSSSGLPLLTMFNSSWIQRVLEGNTIRGGDCLPCHNDKLHRLFIRVSGRWATQLCVFLCAGSVGVPSAQTHHWRRIVGGSPLQLGRSEEDGCPSRGQLILSRNRSFRRDAVRQRSQA